VPCPLYCRIRRYAAQIHAISENKSRGLAGVAIQILGDLRIDGGQFQFAVSYFRTSGSTSAFPEMQLDVRQNYRESFDSKESSSRRAALGWGLFGCQCHGRKRYELGIHRVDPFDRRDLFRYVTFASNFSTGLTAINWAKRSSKRDGSLSSISNSRCFGLIKSCATPRSRNCISGS